MAHLPLHVRLRLADDQAAVEGHRAELEVEAVAVLVGPGGADLGPERGLPFAFDHVDVEVGAVLGWGA